MGINYLNFFNNSFIFQINLESSGLMPMEVPSYIDDCEAVANGFGLTGSERDFEPGDRMGAGAFVKLRPW